MNNTEDKLSVLLPGFDISFDFEYSEEEYRIAKELGVTAESSQFRIRDYRSVSYLLKELIDFPLLLVLIDNLLIDEELLDKTLDEFIKNNAYFDMWSIMMGEDPPPDKYYAECIKYLVNKSSTNNRIFSIYSTTHILNKHKAEFKELLIHLVTNRGISDEIKKVANPISYYGEMVVPPWLYEGFSITQSLFIQMRYSGSGYTPCLIDADREKLFNAVIPYGHSDKTILAFREENNILLNEFINILFEVSRKIGEVPLSKMFKLPEKIADKIFEMRENKEIKNARKALFKIYNQIRAHYDKVMINEEVPIEIEKARKERALLKFQTAFILAAGSMAVGGSLLYAGIESMILSLPITAYSIGDALYKKWKQLKNLNWIGFINEIRKI